MTLRRCIFQNSRLTFQSFHTAVMALLLLFSISVCLKDVTFFYVLPCALICRACSSMSTFRDLCLSFVIRILPIPVLIAITSLWLPFSSSSSKVFCLWPTGMLRSLPAHWLGRISSGNNLNSYGDGQKASLSRPDWRFSSQVIQWLTQDCGRCCAFSRSFRVFVAKLCRKPFWSRPSCAKRVSGVALFTRIVRKLDFLCYISAFSEASLFVCA